MKFLQFYEDRGLQPKYKALADAIAKGIAQHLLNPGDSLPTQRALATLLGVTVGTVTRAYAEAAQRGLVIGVIGKGTFIATPRQDVDTMPSRQSHAYDLGYISPFEYLSPSIHEAMGHLKEIKDVDFLTNYQHPCGLLRHREAGALWTQQYGLSVHPNDILICAGAQHALLVTLMALFNPGDRIAAEPLTFPLFKQLARRLSLQLVPVRMDSNGMLPDALETISRSGGGIQGVYLMPTCHNPTLAQIPEGRRHQLVEVCRRHQIKIIEDDVFALTLRSNLTPLTALAPELSCFIATTSEALSGGLRIAYLSPPQQYYEKLERAIACTVSMAPPFMAELARLWILDGTADTILQAKREAAFQRNTLVRQVLDGFAPKTRDTGFFCWLKLPEPWTATQFSFIARQQGVVVIEGDHFALSHGAPEEGIRIALGSLPQETQLKESLQILGHILQNGVV